MEQIASGRDVGKLQARLGSKLGAIDLFAIATVPIAFLGNLAGLVSFVAVLGTFGLAMALILWRRSEVLVTLTPRALTIERHHLGRVTASELLPLDGIRQVRADRSLGLVVTGLDGSEVVVELGGHTDHVEIRDLLQSRLAGIQPASIEELEPPRALEDLRQRDRERE